MCEAAKPEKDIPVTFCYFWSLPSGPSLLMYLNNWWCITLFYEVTITLYNLYESSADNYISRISQNCPLNKIDVSDMTKENVCRDICILFHSTEDCDEKCKRSIFIKRQRKAITQRHKQKSCIRETKHLSTNADSSTDTTVGWTKNTKNPIFLKNAKNHPKRKNSKCLEIWQY